VESTISSFNDKSRAKEAPLSSSGQFPTGKSRMSSKYIDYSKLYFSRCQCEKHLNRYSYLLKGSIFPSGIGLEKTISKKEVQNT
jgi:hypothetical protein